jgi:hypothetical protein
MRGNEKNNVGNAQNAQAVMLNTAQAIMLTR